MKSSNKSFYLSREPARNRARTSVSPVEQQLHVTKKKQTNSPLPSRSTLHYTYSTNQQTKAASPSPNKKTIRVHTQPPPPPQQPIAITSTRTKLLPDRFYTQYNSNSTGAAAAASTTPTSSNRFPSHNQLFPIRTPEKIQHSPPQSNSSVKRATQRHDASTNKQLNNNVKMASKDISEEFELLKNRIKHAELSNSKVMSKITKTQRQNTSDPRNSSTSAQQGSQSTRGNSLDRLLQPPTHSQQQPQQHQQQQEQVPFLDESLVEQMQATSKTSSRPTNQKSALDYYKEKYAQAVEEEQNYRREVKQIFIGKDEEIHALRVTIDKLNAELRAIKHTSAALTVKNNSLTSRLEDTQRKLDENKGQLISILTANATLARITELEAEITAKDHLIVQLKEQSQQLYYQHKSQLASEQSALNTKQQTYRSRKIEVERKRDSLIALLSAKGSASLPDEQRRHVQEYINQLNNEMIAIIEEQTKSSSNAFNYLNGGTAADLSSTSRAKRASSSEHVASGRLNASGNHWNTNVHIEKENQELLQLIERAESQKEQFLIKCHSVLKEKHRDVPVFSDFQSVLKALKESESSSATCGQCQSLREQIVLQEQAIREVQTTFADLTERYQREKSEGQMEKQQLLDRLNSINQETIQSNESAAVEAESIQPQHSNSSYSELFALYQKEQLHLTELVREKDALDEQLKKAQRECQQNRLKSDKLSSENAQLQRIVLEQAQSILNLQKQYERLSTQLNEEKSHAAEQLASSRNAIDVATKDKATAQISVEQLQQQLESLGTRYEQLNTQQKEEINSKDIQLRKMQLKIQSLTDQRQHSEDEENEQQKQIRLQLQEEIDTLKGRIASLLMEIDVARENLIREQNVIAEQEKAIVLFKSAADELKQAMNQKQLEVQESQLQCQEFMHTQTQLNREIAQLNANCGRLEKQVDSLAEQLSQAVVRMSEFAKEKEELSEQLEASEVRRNSVNNVMDGKSGEFMEQLNALSAANQILRDQLSEMEQASEVLRQSLEEARQIKITGNITIEQLSLKNQEMDEQINVAETRVRNIADEYERFKQNSNSRVEQLEKKNQELSSELESAGEGKQQSGGQLKSVQLALESAQESIELLTGKLEEFAAQADEEKGQLRTDIERQFEEKLREVETRMVAVKEEEIAAVRLSMGESIASIKEQFEGRIAQLGEEIASQQHRNVEQAYKLDAANAELVEKSSELEVTQQQLKQQLDEINQMKALIQPMEETENILKEQIDVLEKKQKDIATENQKFVQSQEEQQQLIRAMEEKNTQLILERDETVQQQLRQIELQKTVIDQLEIDVKTAKEEATRLIQSIEEHEQEKETLIKQNQQLLDEKLVKEDETKEMIIEQEKFVSQQIVIAVAEEKKQSLLALEQVLQESNSKQEIMKSDYDHLIHQLKEDITEKQQELDRNNAEIESKNTQITDLKREMDHEKEILSTQIQELNLSIKEHSEISDQLMNQVAAEKQVQQTQVEQLQQFQVQSDEQVNQIQQLQSQVNQLESSIEQSNESIASKDKMIMELKQSIEDHLVQIELMNGEENDLKKQLQVAKDLEQDLREQLVNQDQLVQSKFNEVRQLNFDLEEQLKHKVSLQNRLAATNGTFEDDNHDVSIGGGVGRQRHNTNSHSYVNDDDDDSDMLQQQVHALKISLQVQSQQIEQQELKIQDFLRQKELDESSLKHALDYSNTLSSALKDSQKELENYRRFSSRTDRESSSIYYDKQMMGMKVKEGGDDEEEKREDLDKIIEDITSMCDEFVNEEDHHEQHEIDAAEGAGIDEPHDQDGSVHMSAEIQINLSDLHNPSPMVPQNQLIIFSSGGRQLQSKNSLPDQCESDRFSEELKSKISERRNSKAKIVFADDDEGMVVAVSGPSGLTSPSAQMLMQKLRTQINSADVTMCFVEELVKMFKKAMVMVEGTILQQISDRCLDVVNEVVVGEGQQNYSDDDISRVLYEKLQQNISEYSVSAQAVEALKNCFETKQNFVSDFLVKINENLVEKLVRKLNEVLEKVLWDLPCDDTILEVQENWNLELANALRALSEKMSKQQQQQHHLQVPHPGPFVTDRALSRDTNKSEVVAEINQELINLRSLNNQLLIDIKEMEENEEILQNKLQLLKQEIHEKNHDESAVLKSTLKTIFPKFIAISQTEKPSEATLIERQQYLNVILNLLEFSEPEKETIQQQKRAKKKKNSWF